MGSEGLKRPREAKEDDACVQRMPKVPKVVLAEAKVAVNDDEDRRGRKSFVLKKRECNAEEGVEETSRPGQGWLNKSRERRRGR